MGQAIRRERRLAGPCGGETRKKRKIRSNQAKNRACSPAFLLLQRERASQVHLFLFVPVVTISMPHSPRVGICHGVFFFLFFFFYFFS